MDTPTIVAIMAIVVSAINSLFMFFTAKGDRSKEREASRLDARLLKVEEETKQCAVRDADLRGKIDSLIQILDRVEKNIDKLEV